MFLQLLHSLTTPSHPPLLTLSPFTHSATPSIPSIHIMITLSATPSIHLPSHSLHSFTQPLPPFTLSSNSLHSLTWPLPPLPLHDCKKKRLPQFPTSSASLSTVESHCLLYIRIPNSDQVCQNISNYHGRMLY